MKQNPQAALDVACDGCSINRGPCSNDSCFQSRILNFPELNLARPCRGRLGVSGKLEAESITRRQRAACPSDTAERATELHTQPAAFDRHVEDSRTPVRRALEPGRSARLLRCRGDIPSSRYSRRVAAPACLEDVRDSCETWTEGRKGSCTNLTTRYRYGGRAPEQSAASLGTCSC
jgi:hypothetical protein